LLEKPKHLVLIGMKSCGKTAIGQSISQIVGCKFFDTDREIEKLYTKKTNKYHHYQQIYQEIGDANFRSLEEKAIKRIVSNDEKLVIATGGGSIINQNNTFELKKKGYFVYLRASFSTLYQRWQKNPPSFIDQNHIEQALKKYYKIRFKIYQQFADIDVMVDDKTVADICCDVIMKWVS